MFVIKKRGRQNAIRRGGMYGLIILSTFSRAARIARFAQTGILILMQYQKKILKILLYGALPMLIVFGSITYVGRDQIIGRTFSNLGHFKMITEAIQKVKEKPLRGQGAGSA